MTKVSNCCGAYLNSNVCEDIGICPECGEHCDFVEEDGDDQ